MNYEQEYNILVEEMVALLGQILGEVTFDDYELQLIIEEKYNEFGWAIRRKRCALQYKFSRRVVGRIFFCPEMGGKWAKIGCFEKKYSL